MQGRLVVCVSAEKDLPYCTEVKRVCIAHYFLLTEVPLAVSQGKVSEGGIHQAEPGFSECVPEA